MPVTFANKGCCGILVISHSLPDPDSEPWGAQEGEKGAFLSHPQWCTLRRLRTGKNWILVLSSQGAYQRNKFKESRLLHLPILRKALKKKFEMYYFLLLTVIFWCSDYLVYVAKLLYNLVHPLHLQGSPSVRSERIFFRWCASWVLSDSLPPRGL